MSAKVSRPIVRVVIENADDQTLTEYIVQTDNRDAVRFDMLRARRSWPGGDVAPVLWLTVTAWSALERTKVYTGKIDAFLDVCVDVEAVDENGAPIVDGEDTAADPTQAEAVTD